MVHVRCPRCGWDVELAFGRTSVCPRCGFGAQPPPLAAGPVPAAPVPSTRTRHTALVVAAYWAAFAVVAAGSVAAVHFMAKGPPGTVLPEEEAERRMADAVAALRDSFGADGVLASLVVPPPALDEARGLRLESDHDLFDRFQGAQEERVDGILAQETGITDLTAAWGPGPTARVEMSLGPGDEDGTATVSCAPEGIFTVWQGRVARERRMYGLDPCGHVGVLFGRASEDAPFLLPEDLAGLDVVASPGAVAGMLDDGLTLFVFGLEEHDASWRLASVEAIGPDGVTWMGIDYGPRAAIEPPAGALLEPADLLTKVSWYDEWAGVPMQVYDWTVQVSFGYPPRSEFEVRVFRDGAVVASFPLDAPGRQEQAGFAFTSVDYDGNGKVSPYDSFTLLADAWAPERLRVVVHDLAAGKPIDEERTGEAPPLL